MKFCLCLQSDKDTIETYHYHFWLLFNAFIIHHVVLFLRDVSDHSLGLAYADTFHFYVWNHNSFTHQFVVSPICFHYISNIPLVQNMTVCWWRRFEFIRQLCVDAYTRFSPQVEPTSWCFFIIIIFPFLLFPNQCASPVPIRDTKSARLRSNLLSKKHCLIRFRSMTGPHRFPMTHIISILT